MRKKRKPKLLNCEVVNAPRNQEEQETYDDLVFETLATALSRCLDSSEMEQIISQLEGVE